ncbi:MAG: thioredoxin-dependent thiol peroxidase [Clostridia bacterium]|nr:thioredoxin-dependent thiol peroxidase [Clostridia bacterium]
MLSIGSKAPDFTLSDKNGNKVSLSDLKGKRVVIYFYSKDNTSGCTKQACAFAAHYPEFEKLGAEVIGISRDSVESHKRFAEKYSLPFILLSDTELDAIQKYGVWQEKKNYGKTVMGVVRSTFIIDIEGNIEHIMVKVNAENNASDVLKLISLVK